MPVFQRDTLADKPPWVEIEDYETFILDSALESATRTLRPAAAQEVVIVLSGRVVAESEQGWVTLERKNWMQVPASGLKLTVLTNVNDICTAEVLRIAGDWTDTTVLATYQVRPDRELELHYHDFHEYWLIFRGSGSALVDGAEVELKAGDLVATATGVEHAMAATPELVEGVAFETALRGQRRLGHLHREEHGDPVPQYDGA